MALHIIRHAFRMIFGNFEQALRVSVGPFLILIACAYPLTTMPIGETFLAVIPDPFADDIGESIGSVDPLVIIYLIFLIFLTLFVFGWVAVAWHRFILLEEYHGLLPAAMGRPIWPYVWRSISYGFLVLLAGIPLLFVVGIVAGILIRLDVLLPLADLFINAFIIGGVLGWIWFRIALALPSVAVGKPIKISNAWSASARMSGTVFGIAILIALINMIAGWLAEMASSELALLGYIIDLAIQWLTLMLGVSVLTTLYGHLIEKRPLIE